MGFWDKFDPINRLIPLSVIPLSVTNCIRNPKDLVVYKLSGSTLILFKNKLNFDFVSNCLISADALEKIRADTILQIKVQSLRFKVLESNVCLMSLMYMYKCTRVENPGEGVAKIFARILNKISKGFINIFIIKVSENLL